MLLISTPFSVYPKNMTWQLVSKPLVRMFSRVHIIAAFTCFWVGMGIAPQHAPAQAPNPSKDLLSMLRSGKSSAAKNDSVPNAASAASYYRRAQTYAEQKDVNRANTNFSLALQNATPRQIASIAADYAAFLTDTGDLHRAELMLRQALAVSPGDTDITRMLARCLVRQDKMVEGLRYFKSIGTESEAKAEIAAIYLEQGNTDMLIAAERRWGAASPQEARPSTVRPEPALVAAAPRPATVRPESARPATVRPEPTPKPALVATTSRPEPDLIASAPRKAMAPPLPGKADTLPLTQMITITAPRVEVAPREVAFVAAAPVSPPLSKSEFFDNRVPIPVPGFAASPAGMVATSPKLAPAVSTPAREQLAPKSVLMNPIRLAAAPMPLPKKAEAAEAKESSPKPAAPAQPRRHYVVNAGASDLSVFLPGIQPTVATVPVQNSRDSH